MSKHTPGTWEAINADDTDNWSDNVVCTLGDGWYVYSESEPRYDSMEPDARLIAAAPDMLETLEVIANYCTCDETKEVAKQTIAKAKGEFQ